MKLHCHVCHHASATLLCCAHDAALCSYCDSHVHAANTLAGNHERVPLIGQNPSCCDICQENLGHFFCIQDRALLCRDCDFSVHSSNNLASNHKRFLVSGVQVGLEALGPPPLPTTIAPPSTHIAIPPPPPPPPPTIATSTTHIAIPPPPPTTIATSTTHIAIPPPPHPTIATPTAHISIPPPAWVNTLSSNIHSYENPQGYADLTDFFAKLDYFLDLPADMPATTYSEPPSKMGSLSLGCGVMLNTGVALDVLYTSTPLFEDSIAEVPATPIASMPSIEVPGSLKHKRQAHAPPPFTSLDHTVVVPNTTYPAFKKSRMGILEV